MPLSDVSCEPTGRSNNVAADGIWDDGEVVAAFRHPLTGSRRRDPPRPATGRDGTGGSAKSAKS